MALSVSLDIWSGVLRLLEADDACRLGMTCAPMRTIVKSSSHQLFSFSVFPVDLRRLSAAGGVCGLYPNVETIRIKREWVACPNAGCKCARNHTHDAVPLDAARLLGKYPRLKELSTESLLFLDADALAALAATSSSHLRVLDVAIGGFASFNLIGNAFSHLVALKLSICSPIPAKGCVDEFLVAAPSPVIVMFSLLAFFPVLTSVSLSYLYVERGEPRVEPDAALSLPQGLTRLSLSSVRADFRDCAQFVYNMPKSLTDLTLEDCALSRALPSPASAHHFLLRKMPPLLKRLRLDFRGLLRWIDVTGVDDDRLASMHFDHDGITLGTDSAGNTIIPNVLSWNEERFPFRQLLSLTPDVLSGLLQSSGHPRVRDIWRACRAARPVAYGQTVCPEWLREGELVAQSDQHPKCGLPPSLSVVSAYTMQSRAQCAMGNTMSLLITDWNNASSLSLFLAPNALVSVSLPCTAQELAIVVSASPSLRRVEVELASRPVGIVAPLAYDASRVPRLALDWLSVRSDYLFRNEQRLYALECVVKLFSRVQSVAITVPAGSAGSIGNYFQRRMFAAIGGRGVRHLELTAPTARFRPKEHKTFAKYVLSCIVSCELVVRSTTVAYKKGAWPYELPRTLKYLRLSTLEDVKNHDIRL